MNQEKSLTWGKKQQKTSWDTQIHNLATPLIHKMHHESKISNIVNEGADHPILQKNIKFGKHFYGKHLNQNTQKKEKKVVKINFGWDVVPYHFILSFLKWYKSPILIQNSDLNGIYNSILN